MALIAELRAAAAPAHERLERSLDLFHRIGAPAGRKAVVGRFLGLHGGLERALEPRLRDWPGLDFASRRRAPRLAADYAVLGGDPARVPLHPDPGLTSDAQALGVFYVLEGSTLGGAVIEKQLKARGESLKGLSFLHPYGDQTGARWRAFLAVLEAAPAAGAGEVVQGALLGFACAQDWLCRPGDDV